MIELKRTPLYDDHQRRGAKFLPFAGWEMPIEYQGIITEHKAVRENMGVFDVSHMGEIEIKGKTARNFCQMVSTNDVSMLKPGKVQYTVLLNEEGGIIDDCTLYCLSPEHYLFVVNAARKDDVYHWLSQQKMDSTLAVEDKSDDYGLIALQGPKSESFLARFVKRDLRAFKYYDFIWAEILGVALMISRTGYTGEDGFEIYVPMDKVDAVWRQMIEEGASENLQPIGLGARDTLRLEMGYLLYGSDMNQKTSPLECGLSWITKMNKGHFLGRQAILDQKEKGVTRRLRGFKMTERGIPRSHFQIFEGDNLVGEVTSGTYSPSLKVGLGLAMIDKSLNYGSNIAIKIRDKMVSAIITKPPFVQGSVKK
ncbi:MAG: glycine cleavage system aminomethyltransferase GcvT [Bdellovibrionales bacterium]|nr:glycine cleavage system aminomethyltransferase GcvT [Bdellovibrionales bacterium]